MNALRGTYRVEDLDLVQTMSVDLITINDLDYRTGSLSVSETQRFSVSKNGFRNHPGKG